MKRRSLAAFTVGLLLLMVFMGIPVVLLALNKMWAIGTLVVIWGLSYAVLTVAIIDLIEDKVDARAERKREETRCAMQIATLEDLKGYLDDMDIEPHDKYVLDAITTDDLANSFALRLSEIQQIFDKAWQDNKQGTPPDSLSRMCTTLLPNMLQDGGVVLNILNTQNRCPGCDNATKE